MKFSLIWTVALVIGTLSPPVLSHGAPRTKSQKEDRPRATQGENRKLTVLVRAAPETETETLQGMRTSRFPSRVRFPPVPCKSRLRVVLVGLDGDGAHAFRVDASALATALRVAMPERMPCTAAEEEKGKGERPGKATAMRSALDPRESTGGEAMGRCPFDHRLPLSLGIDYDVVKAPSADIRRYEQALEARLRELDHSARAAREIDSESEGPNSESERAGRKRGKTVPVFDVPVERLEKEIDHIYTSTLPATSQGNEGIHDGPNTVIILNPSRKRMRPIPDATGTPSETDYQYRYVPWGGARVQSWVGAGRYVVVDLSAGPVSYGRTGAGEGTVCSTSFPRISEMISLSKGRLGKKQSTGGGGAKNGAKSDSQASAVATIVSEFRARLASLVIGAVRHVFAPDTRYRSMPPSDKVLVTVIVLKNHESFDPLATRSATKGGLEGIDMKRIKEELVTLMPHGQTLTVLSGSHSLKDHKHVAMAVSKSIRADSRHEISKRTGQYVAKNKPYIDSAILCQELKDSADVLAAGVMSAASPLTKRTFFNTDVPNHPTDEDEVSKSKDVTIAQAKGSSDGKGNDATPEQVVDEAMDNQRPFTPRKFHRSHGVRVLPVYVLSLAGLDKDLLLDGDSLLSVFPDAVIVLQTDAGLVPLPYRTENTPVGAVAGSPSRHIVAGVAASLGSLLPPYTRWHSSRLAHDYMWANGHHPFGPFSNATRVSRILTDVTLRNGIIARLDEAMRVVGEAMGDIERVAGKYLGVGNAPSGGNASLSSETLPAPGPGGSWLLDWLYEHPAGLALTPLAPSTVARLRSDLGRLDELFHQVALEVGEMRLDRARSLVGPLRATAVAFRSYAREELERAERSMDCYVVSETDKGGSTAAWTLASAMVWAGMAYYGVGRVIGGGRTAGGRRQ